MSFLLPGGGRLPRALVLILAIAGCLVGDPRDASAHAALDTSTPTAGDVLAEAPAQVTARFTERLDRSYSRLQLFDQNGALVEGTTLSDGEDEYTMVLTLPPNLPEGTYSILWRTLSKDDGHSAQNYFAFTIGDSSDIVTVIPPATDLSTGDSPQWAKTLSRWVALLGLALAMAIWPIWSVVIRPALTPLWRNAPAIVERALHVAIIGIVGAMFGSVIALIVQALTLDDGTVLDRIVNTLGQTRYGQLALARIGAFATLGLLLSVAPWWGRRHRRVEAALCWVATLALPIPFALIAHAYAQPSGRLVAVIADYLHVLAFGIWFGGLVMLLAILLPVMRGRNAEERRAVFAIALPRFSAISLAAWGVLGLTGFYAGWLHVGNLAALTGTDYGKALIAKLALLALVLVIAAMNLLLVTKRLRTSDAAIWPRRFTWLVSAEVGLVIVAILAVGQLTSLQPARDQVIEESQQVTIPMDLDGRSARLILAPGTTGMNHFRLEVGGDAIPTTTQMLLRLSMPDNENLGTKEIGLSRVAGNAFEYHGNELSISGTWAIVLIERTSGAAPIQAETTWQLTDTREGADVPGDPWRFESLGGTTGLLLLVFGIGGFVAAGFAGKTPLRKESAGLSAAALALGVVLLMQARIDPLLVNARGESAIDPTDVAMIERGEQIYLQACLSCHGADLRGNGPAAVGMDPAPADFSQPHTRVHSDGDLVYWVRNGKQGTAMPAFGNTLSDQEILDVLSYIETQQIAMASGSTTPDPATCTITPLTVGEVRDGVAAGTIAAAQTPVPASDPAVSGETSAAALATFEQVVACTNAGDTMRRLALFSDSGLAAAFPNGVDAAFEGAAAITPVALAADQRVAIVGAPSVIQLIDGRVQVSARIDDPASGGIVTVTAILVQADGGWKVDAFG